MISTAFRRENRPKTPRGDPIRHRATHRHARAHGPAHPCTHATGPVSAGVNIGLSPTSGVGRTKDVGFSGTYRLNRALAVRLGYESITSVR